jgi:hypothetical protein
MIEQIVLVAHVALPPLGCRIFREIPQARVELKKRQGTLSDTRRMLCDSDAA